MNAAPLDIVDQQADSVVCKRRGCGVRFIPYRDYHLFCTNQCRETARDRYRDFDRSDRVCEFCGAGFKPARAQQKCCSKLCKNRQLRRTVVNLSFDADLIRDLQVEGKRLDRSISWLVQRCCRRELCRVGDVE